MTSLPLSTSIALRGYVYTFLKVALWNHYQHLLHYLATFILRLK